MAAKLDLKNASSNKTQNNRKQKKGKKFFVVTLLIIETKKTKNLCQPTSSELLVRLRAMQLQRARTLVKIEVNSKPTNKR
jgi:hypothetical protein